MYDESRRQPLVFQGERVPGRKSVNIISQPNFSNIHGLNITLGFNLMSGIWIRDRDPHIHTTYMLLISSGLSNGSVTLKTCLQSTYLYRLEMREAWERWEYEKRRAVWAGPAEWRLEVDCSSRAGPWILNFQILGLYTDGQRERGLSKEKELKALFCQK
jgi:hypothetical protein